MKRVVYIMHIEWGWIKQRPHFILKNLVNNFDVSIFFQTMYKRFKRNKNDEGNLRINRLFNLPFKSFGFVYNIDRFVISKFFKLYFMFYRPDLIILTHPEQMDYVRELSVPIVYDCMDLHMAMTDNKLVRLRIGYLEKELLTIAAGVVFSSKRLNYLLSSYSRRSVVIPNGIEDSLLSLASDSEYTTNKTKNDEYIIIYNGVVSERIDFDILRYIIHKYNNISFEIVGPIMGDAPQLERVRYLGGMEHKDMLSYSRKADAFIMPHVINEMVLSMDPVKIYEYIALDRPILSIYYEELDKFAEFVNFYSNTDDIDLFIKNMMSNRLKSNDKEKRLDFLRESTWNSRSEVFLKFISEII